MSSINIEQLLSKFSEIPELVKKEVENEIKKSAIQVRDTAVKKFGKYQPAEGPYPAWEELTIQTVTNKVNHGAGGAQPLIGTYGSDVFQPGNKVTKNGAWPAPLRNTIGIKIEGITAAIGTDDPLGTYHEFGAPRANIPPRPFLRPALYENQDNIKENLKKGITNCIMHI